MVATGGAVTVGRVRSEVFTGSAFRTSRAMVPGFALPLGNIGKIVRERLPEE